MKKLMVLIIATLTTSVAEARITDADIDRINAEARANLLRTMPNALNPEVARADIEQKWQLYNQPPHEDANNSNRKWYSQAFVQGRSYTNNYSHEIVVNASGGTRSNGNPYDDQNNRCQLSIIVDGHIVASSTNNNNHFSKECFVTASVPVNSRYQITSNPWQSSGSYSTRVNVLR